MNRFCSSINAYLFVNVYLYRTRQEEMRVYKRNHTSMFTDNENDTNDFGSTAIPLNDTENSQNTYPSFTFSTETCIYVHAALMASLFVIAISR